MFSLYLSFKLKILVRTNHIYALFVSCVDSEILKLKCIEAEIYKPKKYIFSRHPVFELTMKLIRSILFSDLSLSWVIELSVMLQKLQLVLKPKIIN